MAQFAPNQHNEGMKMNPYYINLIILGCGIGYLQNDIRGLVWGAVTVAAISLCLTVAEMINGR